MAETWTKEDPKVDGVHWWRADANDRDPDIHSVVAGRFYEVGMTQCTVVENFGGEWLGPITPSDFEQAKAATEITVREAVAETWKAAIGIAKARELKFDGADSVVIDLESAAAKGEQL